MQCQQILKNGIQKNYKVNIVSQEFKANKSKK